MKSITPHFKIRFVERKISSVVDEKELTKMVEVKFNMGQYKDQKLVDNIPRYTIAIVSYKWENKNLLVLVDKATECTLTLVTAFFEC